jgi:hypothetical protein
MELLDERTAIATVAERWKAQYLNARGWIHTSTGSSQAIYDRLCQLPADATVRDVEAIIGNDTWTSERCSECGNRPAVVMVGETPDYETSTAWLCLPCVAKLVALVRPLLMNGPKEPILKETGTIPSGSAYLKASTDLTGKAE